MPEREKIEKPGWDEKRETEQAIISISEPFDTALRYEKLYEAFTNPGFLVFSAWLAGRIAGLPMIR